MATSLAETIHYSEELRSYVYALLEENLQAHMVDELEPNLEDLVAWDSKITGHK